MGFKIEQGEKFALLAFSGLTIGIDDQSRAKLAARPRISIIARIANGEGLDLVLSARLSLPRKEMRVRARKHVRDEKSRRFKSAALG
jgi:hypothetical protein